MRDLAVDQAELCEWGAGFDREFVLGDSAGVAGVGCFFVLFVDVFVHLAVDLVALWVGQLLPCCLDRFEGNLPTREAGSGNRHCGWQC